MKKAELLKIMLNTWKQFAWRSYVDNKPHLVAGGLKSLEEIRAVLVKHMMINPTNGLPPRFPTDERGGFQRATASPRFQSRFARKTNQRGQSKTIFGQTLKSKTDKQENDYPGKEEPYDHKDV